MNKPNYLTQDPLLPPSLPPPLASCSPHPPPIASCSSPLLFNKNVVDVYSCSSTTGSFMLFFHKIYVVVQKSDKVAWSRHVEMKRKWLCLDDAKSKTACLLFPSTCYLGNQPASNESIVINASSAIVKDGVVAAGEYNLQKKKCLFFVTSHLLVGRIWRKF